MKSPDSEMLWVKYFKQNDAADVEVWLGPGFLDPSFFGWHSRLVSMFDWFGIYQVELNFGIRHSRKTLGLPLSREVDTDDRMWKGIHQVAWREVKPMYGRDGRRKEVVLICYCPQDSFARLHTYLFGEEPPVPDFRESDTVHLFADQLYPAWGPPSFHGGYPYRPPPGEVSKYRNQFKTPEEKFAEGGI